MSPSEHAPPRGPSTLVSSFLIALLCLIWGSTWLVIKWGLADLPPFTAAGVRFASAWLVFAILAPVLARSEGGERPPWRLRLSHGLLQLAASYGIVYWCETRLPSGLVSLLWSVFPLLMAVSGHYFLDGERLSARQWSGFLLGFGGVGMLFATDLRDIGPGAVPAGMVLMLSPIVVVVANTLVKRHGGHVSSVLLNRDGMSIGAMALLAAGALFESDASFDWTPRAIGSVAYLALVGSVVSFGLYFWLLRYVPAYRLSVIAYVTPMIALGLGAWVDSEPLGANTLAGAGLILVGVALAVAGRRHAPATTAAPAVD